MKLVISLVNVLLTPIDQTIQQFLPDLSNALTSFGNVLNLISDVIGWCVDLTGISSTALGLIITYYVFKLTVPVFFWTVKTAIRWYNAIKL